MKTLFIAILLTAVTVAATGHPVLAEEQLTPAEKKQLFREGEAVAALLQYLSQCTAGFRESAL